MANACGERHGVIFYKAVGGVLLRARRHPEGEQGRRKPTMTRELRELRHLRDQTARLGFAQVLSWTRRVAAECHAAETLDHARGLVVEDLMDLLASSSASRMSVGRWRRGVAGLAANRTAHSAQPNRPPRAQHQQLGGRR